MATSIGSKEGFVKAARFCALRERSPQEVRTKLQQWGAEDKHIQSIIDQLEQEGYVNEVRFARAYCHDKFTFNSWGKQKIKASIYVHALPSLVVDQALASIDSEKYRLRIDELARRKWQQLQSEDLTKKKQKTLSYLANKGFEQDLIWEALRGLESSEKTS